MSRKNEVRVRPGQMTEAERTAAWNALRFELEHPREDSDG